MFEGDQVVIQKSTTAPDPFSAFTNSGLVTHCLPCFLSCGFALMVLYHLALGSYLGYMHSSLALLRVIPCVLVALHPWPLQASLHLKFKP